MHDGRWGGENLGGWLISNYNMMMVLEVLLFPVVFSCF